MYWVPALVRATIAFCLLGANAALVAPAPRHPTSAGVGSHRHRVQDHRRALSWSVRMGVGDRRGGAGPNALGQADGTFRHLGQQLGDAMDLVDDASACEAWKRQWDDFLTATVLIVGDGNLSFSLAMARAFATMRLIVTTYDSHDVVIDRYGAAEIISELRERGATVLHDVDATKLLETLGPHLGTDFAADCIVFNFPHHPGKGKIQVNRELLRSFFTSACRHLSARGEVRVALAAGQGGTPFDKPRKWGDTWQVWMDGWMVGWLDGWMDIHTYLCVCVSVCLCVCVSVCLCVRACSCDWLGISLVTLHERHMEGDGTRGECGTAIGQGSRQNS